MVWTDHTWQTTPAQCAAQHMLLTALPSSNIAKQQHPSASTRQRKPMPALHVHAEPKPYIVGCTTTTLCLEKQYVVQYRWLCL